MELDKNNVVWDSPGSNASGSMPIGNGDIGLNVWVEENGDLLFYLSKNDSWSENMRLLKLGRIRISLSSHPFRQGQPFLQSLLLREGCIVIEAGEASERVLIRIWVDANRPVVRVEIQGNHEFVVRTELEMWRNRERVLEGIEKHGANMTPEPRIEYPDTLMPDAGDRIVWYHRNRTSFWHSEIQGQGLPEAYAKEHKDPLLGLTFGAIIKGDGFLSASDAVLQSEAPAARHLLSIYPHTALTDTAEDWLREAEEKAMLADETGLSTAYEAHMGWWRQFWNRSWIYVHAGSPTTDEESSADGGTGAEAAAVTQGYTLQRFMNACGGRGTFPIKFNGSIFTFSGLILNEQELAQMPPTLSEGPFDADFRMWGGFYWYQNTRLVYASMLKSGDTDLMQPFIRMYGDALALVKQVIQIGNGYEGAATFAEVMPFWGKSLGRIDRDAEPYYGKFIYFQIIELACLLLDYYDYTCDDAFLHERALPIAEAGLRFYDLHFSRDGNGKLNIEPADANETYWKTRNPSPDIAGLSMLLSRLLALPSDALTVRQREDWTRLLDELPELPKGEREGLQTLLPAQQYGEPRNHENPELYAVYPFRMFGIGRPELELARDTFRTRRVQKTGGWFQDAVQAACLGDTETAKTCVVSNFSNRFSGSRFPAFWGP
ncbi:MAG: hypothetical protein K0R67_3622, partial [Paenibacillus sp.]|nr:hypothetical protein [Paenibacillus sp.]